MTVNGILEKLENSGPITEKDFDLLIKDFRQSYLRNWKFNERVALHRSPNEVREKALRDLSDYLIAIQNRAEMRDTDLEKRSSGYVPSKISELWESDKRLKSLYNTIKAYCVLRSKNFNVIAVHIAEYRAMYNLYRSIRRSANKHIPTIKSATMPKNFEIERRETFEKPYLKVFLAGGLDHERVAKHLESLHSVHRANVTIQKNQKKDLTIYPQKAYSIEEVEQEVELTLDNYFKGNPVDPSFLTETLSSISDKAYLQILDYIILLGKNLEGFKELNAKFDEERYRDYFIPFLNAISTQYSAKGEVFNRKGKTDILVFDNKGHNIFIAECKLWKGEAYLLSAVDQLLGNYVNWRDEKTAIVIFNRDVKKFSDVIDKATKVVADHPLCLKDLGNRTDASFSYLFRNPDDENKTIRMELVLLNFA